LFRAPYLSLLCLSKIGRSGTMKCRFFFFRSEDFPISSMFTSSFFVSLVSRLPIASFFMWRFFLLGSGSPFDFFLVGSPFFAALFVQSLPQCNQSPHLGIMHPEPRIILFTPGARAKLRSSPLFSRQGLLLGDFFLKSHMDVVSDRIARPARDDSFPHEIAGDILLVLRMASALCASRGSYDLSVRTCRPTYPRSDSFIGKRSLFSIVLR